MGARKLPERFISRVIDYGGDAAAGALTLGVLLGNWVPIVLGLLGIAWFVLRFVNFFRVNAFDKKSWRMHFGKEDDNATR